MVYLLLLYLFSMTGSSAAIYGCLTWEIRGYTLILTCRPDNFVERLSILDVHGTEHGVCTFHGHIPQCVSYKNGNITADFEQMKITLEINNIQTDVNGKWLCLQGNSEFASVVSTSEGIIAATDVYLYGQYLDYGHVKFTCSSCREPAGNYVEFFIDGKSVTGITYSHRTRKCKKADGECKPGVCSCSVSGNQFTNVFVISNETKEQMFSCEMRFADPLLSNRFYKTATIQYNGSDLITKRTITKLTKPAGKKFVPLNSSEDVTSTSTPFTSAVPTTTKITNNSKTQSTMWILVGIICLLLILILTYFFVKKRKQRNLRRNNDTSKTTASMKVDSSSFECQGKSEESICLIVDEETSSVQKRHILKGKCEPCSRRKITVNAIFWCMDCDESQCLDCNTMHKTMKVSCNHKVVDTEKIPVNFPTSSLLICKIHSDCKNDYFCNNHDTLCCRECLTATHRCCTEITDVLKCEPMVNTLVEALRGKIDTISMNLTKVKEAHKNANTKIAEDAKRIEKSLSTLSRLIEETPNQPDSPCQKRSYIALQLKELELLQGFATDFNHEIMTELEKLELSATEQHSFIDFMATDGSPRHLFLLIHSSINQTVKDIQDQLNNIIVSGAASRLQYQKSERKSVPLGTMDIIYEQVLDSSFQPILRSQFQVPVHNK